MRTVRFFEGRTLWPYTCQSPANDGVFGSTRFLFGPGAEPADWLVVLNEIPEGANLTFPRDRAIFLSGEPPSIRKFNARYLAQFGTAISVDPDLPHPHRIAAPPLIPWHVGMRAFEPETWGDAMTFAQLEPAPAKLKLCSCIASAQRGTPGHRARFDFVHRLRDQLGDRIDFFGAGHDQIADKNEGLAGYRYHIAIENSAVPHYWTEKLVDPFLRNCFPIYYGAPNIADYFDPASMAVIDVGRPEEAIKKITEVLDSDIDLRSAPAVSEAKRKVMWEYNLLARIDHMLDAAERQNGSSGQPQPIRPELDFSPWLRAHARIQAGSRRLRRRLLPKH